MHRRIAILAVVASTLLLMGLSAGQALAAGDDDIPGIPIGPGTISWGGGRTQPTKYDVYSVKLFDGEDVTFTLNTSVNADGFVPVHLAPPGLKSVHDYYSD